MKKVINPIMKKSYKGGYYNVFMKIELKDNGSLSITGVEGPMSNGNCLGGCGQIDNTLKKDDRSEWRYIEGWDSDMMTKLLEFWDRWHLNDMKAGTPKQEDFIREWTKTNHYSYPEACVALEEAGLLYDGTYRYGSAWMREEVPQEVTDWLFDLPESENEPAWV